MRSSGLPEFWSRSKSLPESVRQQARQAYAPFESQPYHPSLRFRQVHAVRPIFSVRVGSHHRAVGVRRAGEIYWFWIGSHAEYDNLLRQI